MKRIDKMEVRLCFDTSTKESAKAFKLPRKGSGIIFETFLSLRHQKVEAKDMVDMGHSLGYITKGYINRKRINRQNKAA